MKIRNLAISIIGLTAFSSLLAKKSLSLMLSTAEQEAIAQAKKNTQQLSEKEEEPDNEIHTGFKLTSIMWLSPTQWTIWLNGKPYRPADKLPFKILEVQPHGISFLNSKQKKIYVHAGESIPEEHLTEFNQKEFHHNQSSLINDQRDNN